MLGSKSEIEHIPGKGAIRSYRDLKVWAKAMDWVTESYKLTKLLPKAEIYGLCSQIQRSAVSIPANIAEGHGREHLGDYLRCLSIASGSLAELETHLLIANRLTLVGSTELEPVLVLADEISRMLSGLTRKLKALAPGPSHLTPETSHLAPNT